MSPALQKEHWESEEARDNDSQKSHQQFTFGTGIGICKLFFKGKRQNYKYTLLTFDTLSQRNRLQEGSSV